MANINKVAIFGATGMTGVCVLQAALDKGLAVKALTRNSSNLLKKYKGKVDIVQGDVLNVEDVKKTLEGQDAAIVVLGTRNDLGPTTMLSEGLKNILAAMEALNIKIISVCLSLFLFYEREQVPAMFENITDDHRRMLKALQGSELHWIAVNSPYITDKPPTGYTTKQGENTRYTSISKYDLATFFVDSLFMPEYYQKVVGIASKPSRQ